MAARDAFLHRGAGEVIAAEQEVDWCSRVMLLGGQTRMDDPGV
jgi:hypothetical protein